MGRDQRAVARLIGPLVAAGLLVGLLTATWGGLWREPPSSTLVIVAVLGILPPLVRALVPRRPAVWSTLAALVVGVAVLGASVGSNPLNVVRGDGQTWSDLGRIIADGLGNAATTTLPLRSEGTLPLSALLVVVLGGAACLIAWQAIVARNPLTAVIATATGLAYTWTLVPPDQPVVIGLVTLAAALVAFRLCSRTPPGPRTAGRAAATGTAVLALALVGSIGVTSASGAWWDWRGWTFGAKRTPTTLNLNQEYGPLSYPDDPVVIARVTAERTVPLRAATLSRFDGNAFTQAAVVVDQTSTQGTGTLDLIPDASGDETTVRQRIQLGNTRSPFLLAGGRPTTVRGLGRRAVEVFDDGSLRLQPQLSRNTVYEVETLVPDPGAPALQSARTYLDELSPELLTITPGGGAPPVRVPVWGSNAPRPSAADFGRYRDVYEYSRTIVGNAKTPYGAVNRVEAALRRLRYDTTVERPSPGTPDLVAFLLDTKTGYCQHFAGAMTLMLRMHGIPARVAVGFTIDSSRYNPVTSTATIVDRDAHSWVEVYFTGYGWMAFDPTPSRAVPNSASVSSPDYTSTGIDIVADPGISEGSVLPTPPPERALREDPPTAVDPATQNPSGTTAWWWALLGIPVLAGMTPPILKGVRRRRRQRGGERRAILGAAREFESFLLDVGRPPDPASTPAERAATVWRDLGIDAARIYTPASEARFSPLEPPTGSADAVWRAVRAAKRRIGWRRRLRAGLRISSLRTRT